MIAQCKYGNVFEYVYYFDRRNLSPIIIDEIISYNLNLKMSGWI